MGVTLPKTEKPLSHNDFSACQKLTKPDSRISKCRLRSQILGQVGDGVALDGHAGGCPGEAGGGGGVNPGGVINEVGGKGGVPDLVIGELAGQLMDDGSHHFQMAEFLCTERRVKMEPESKNA